MWFESGDPDRQVKNLGKAVVAGGRYTVNVSSYPIFRLGNYGKGGAPWGEGDMGGVHLVAAEGRGGMGHLCESHKTFSTPTQRGKG